MAERGNLQRVVRTTVRTAAAEVNFNRIPVEDAEDWAQDGHNPELVENAYGEIETAAAPVIEAVLQSDGPIGDEEKYRLAQFTAFQIVRGWRFRKDMQEFLTAHARQHLKMSVTEEQVRKRLRSTGHPDDNEAVREFLDGVLHGSWQVQPPKSVLIQSGIRFAHEQLHPQIFSRPLRILRFNEHLLLTSDTAVGMWAPDADAPRSSGPANARAIFVPLDRRTALAFMANGRAGRMAPAPYWAKHINLAVADHAVKWIYHHPEDRPLDGIELPSPAQLTEEVDNILFIGSDEVRVRGRQVWR